MAKLREKKNHNDNKYVINKANNNNNNNTNKFNSIDMVCYFFLIKIPNATKYFFQEV